MSTAIVCPAARRRREIRQQQAEQRKPGERRIDLRGMHRQRSRRGGGIKPASTWRAQACDPAGKQTAHGRSHTAP